MAVNNRLPGRRILILGGAKSGKTRRALTLAEQSERRFYIATAQAFDAEMAGKISQHRKERGPGWQTIEAPLDLTGALLQVDEENAVAVVDCLTLWLSNSMIAEADVEKETAILVEAMKNAKPALIFVSNEVGLGLVPETPLGRRFRDAQGKLNQVIAAAAHHVEFIAAGLPLTLKQANGL